MAKLALIIFLFVCASVLAAEAASTVQIDQCTCTCQNKSVAEGTSSAAMSRKRREADDDGDEDEAPPPPPPKRKPKKKTRKHTSKKNHKDSSNLKKVGDRTENSNNGGNSDNSLGKESLRGNGNIAAYKSFGNTGGEIGDTESTDGDISFGG